LQNTQERNDQRRGNPDTGVDRHNTDGSGGERHQYQHYNQRRFAANPVANAAKDHRTQRTEEESDGERGPGEDQAGELRFPLKLEEVSGNHRCQKTVDRKFIPLDEITDGACN